MQHNDVVSALSYKTPLAIQSLAAGVYFIECVTANGTTILKFIKE